MYGAPAEETCEVITTGAPTWATTASAPSATVTCRPSSPHTTSTSAVAVAVPPSASVTVTSNPRSWDVWSGSRLGAVNTRSAEALSPTTVASGPEVCCQDHVNGPVPVAAADSTAWSRVATWSTDPSPIAADTSSGADGPVPDGTAVDDLPPEELELRSTWLPSAVDAAGTRWTSMSEWRSYEPPSLPVRRRCRVVGASMSGAVKRATAVVGCWPGATPDQVTAGSTPSQPSPPSTVQSCCQLTFRASEPLASPRSSTVAGRRSPSGPRIGVTTVRLSPASTVSSSWTGRVTVVPARLPLGWSCPGPVAHIHTSTSSRRGVVTESSIRTGGEVAPGGTSASVTHVRWPCEPSTAVSGHVQPSPAMSDGRTPCGRSTTSTPPSEATRPRLVRVIWTEPTPPRTRPWSTWRSGTSRGTSLSTSTRNRGASPGARRPSSEVVTSQRDDPAAAGASVTGRSSVASDGRSWCRVVLQRRRVSRATCLGPSPLRSPSAEKPAQRQPPPPARSTAWSTSGAMTTSNFDPASAGREPWLVTCTVSGRGASTANCSGEPGRSSTDEADVIRARSSGSGGGFTTIEVLASAGSSPSPVVARARSSDTPSTAPCSYVTGTESSVGRPAGSAPVDVHRSCSAEQDHGPPAPARAQSTVTCASTSNVTVTGSCSSVPSSRRPVGVTNSGTSWVAGTASAACGSRPNRSETSLVSGARTTRSRVASVSIAMPAAEVAVAARRSVPVPSLVGAAVVVIVSGGADS